MLTLSSGGRAGPTFRELEQDWELLLRSRSESAAGLLTGRCQACGKVSRGLQPQSSLRRIPTVAIIPMDNPYCGCKLTHVFCARSGRSARRRSRSTSFEPGGCTAFRSDSNGTKLIYPAQIRYLANKVLPWKDEKPVLCGRLHPDDERGAAQHGQAAGGGGGQRVGSSRPCPGVVQYYTAR